MDAFGALCTTFNDNPEAACMPFDKKRAGTVLSDGGAMILLESEESARARDARVYCEVAGFGQTNDASHILRPLPDGVGLVTAIINALIIAKIHPSQISAFNCHARATPVGDAAEVVGIRALIAAGEKYKTFEEFA
jgi:3-oxoacyl-[acyl-carrier-protein] synthase II